MVLRLTLSYIMVAAITLFALFFALPLAIYSFSPGRLLATAMKRSENFLEKAALALTLSTLRTCLVSNNGSLTVRMLD